MGNKSQEMEMCLTKVLAVLFSSFVIFKRGS